MSKIEFANKMHRAFGNIKNVSLVVFYIAIMLVSFRSSNVFGQSLVSSVETRVKVNYDDKTKTFIATQNTVEGALNQGGIFLAKNDVTVPDRNSLLIGGEVTVTLTRQIPVLISDNNQEFVRYSAYSDPYEILKQVDVTVYPEDKVGAELVTDPVAEGLVGQRIVIERAPTFTVSVDEGEKIIRSWGKTIGEVLQGNVALGQRDIIEPPLMASSAGDGRITVTRVNVIETTENVVIPYETTYKNDYNMYEGDSRVSQAGVNGLKKENVRITYHNGEVVDRTVLSSTVIDSSVIKVVVQGVKPYNAGVWWNKIISAANSVGIDGLRMYRMMDCESHGNPFSGTDYKGLFQYDYGTWLTARSDYGGSLYKKALITNGDAQIYVTARKIANEGWGAWPTCAYR